MNATTYDRLVIYSYRRPGQRTDSWAVATGDRPEDVVHRSNSLRRAIAWAEQRASYTDIGQ